MRPGHQLPHGVLRAMALNDAGVPADPLAAVREADGQAFAGELDTLPPTDWFALGVAHLVDPYRRPTNLGDLWDVLA